MYTPEPWGISEKYPQQIKQFDSFGETNVIICGTAGGPDSGPFFPQDAVANARRIVACVNACVGIDTEELETEPTIEQRLSAMHHAMARQTKEYIHAFGVLKAEIEELQHELTEAKSQISEG